MLVRAVKEGDEELFLATMEQGGDPRIIFKHRDNGAETHWCLLTLAANHGHARLVTHLVAAGLDLEGRGQSSQTPLLWAAQHGHHQVLVILLTAGANPHATDYAGQ